MDTVREAKVCQIVLETLNTNSGKRVVFHNDLENLGYRSDEISKAIYLLKKLDLITLSDFFQSGYYITDKGKDAVSIHFLEYWERLGKKEKLIKEAEEIQLKKVFIDYDNAVSQKYGYWISIGFSATALLVSLVSLYFSINK